jgi:hypothetical protein
MEAESAGVWSMPRHGGCRAFAGYIAILGLVLSSGCMGFVHPVTKPAAADLQPNEGIPQECRNHVHVFLVHGVDPLDVGNLDGLTDYVQSLGFIKTHYGMPFHSFFFLKEIRKIHHEDPTARFVLVGFSYGAGLVRDMTNDLERDGIMVDLMVYIDGVALYQRALDRPTNTLKLVNILSCYRDESNTFEDAENARCPDVWHFGTPTHPTTLKILARELAAVAVRVPVVERQLPPLPDTAPHPKPSVLPPPLQAPRVLPPPKEVPPTPTSREGWNFLSPDGNSLGVPGSKPIPDAYATEPGTSGER